MQDHSAHTNIFETQRFRLIPRFLVALVLVFLPLADEEHLNSTSITGIAAALL
jgi:hypothetical protein